MVHFNATDDETSVNLPIYYEISSSSKYRPLVWCESNTSDELAVLDRFKSVDTVSRWVPPSLRALTLEEVIDCEEDDDYARQIIVNGFSDSPFFTSACLLFSERATRLLKDELQPSGEFLPVKVRGVNRSYYMFHCTLIVEAIDLDKSELERFDHGPIRSITKPVFRADVPTSRRLFRMNCPNHFAVFADHETARWLNNELIGIELTPADELV